MKRALQYISLFSSSATLICCALPATLVVLGFGASFAALISFFPQLMWISEHKNLVFLISGFVILSSHLLRLATKNNRCPIGKTRENCIVIKKDSAMLLWLATVLWLIGFIFAYLSPLL